MTTARRVEAEMPERTFIWPLYDGLTVLFTLYGTRDIEIEDFELIDEYVALFRKAILGPDAASQRALAPGPVGEEGEQG
jgi:hypothetical protein